MTFMSALIWIAFFVAGIVLGFVVMFLVCFFIKLAAYSYHRGRRLAEQQFQRKKE